MKIVLPKGIDDINRLDIQTKVMTPFADILVDLVDEISKHILKDRYFKAHPELMALAFWMRRSHIKRLKEHFLEIQGEKTLLGRGVVFHLAPSNVDTIFVYSWFLSLLVGNSNIVRISDKENIQTELLLEVIIAVLSQEKYQLLNNRVAVIRYGHEDMLTQQLSSMADVRVIWGGDKTIEHIRTLPVKATATELTFADKFSFAIIDSKSLLLKQDIERFIEDFYNDAFWFGQMACSSIRMVAWIGDKDDNTKVKEIFWRRLEGYISKHIPEDISPADVVNKLVAECSMAIEDSIQIKKGDNPYINRIKIQSLDDIDEELHCGAGLFYELDVERVSEVFEKSTKKNQTVAYYGFSTEELKEQIHTTLPRGIDRIVPIGKALEFSPVWDGYDLFRSFCREVEIWN